MPRQGLKMLTNLYQKEKIMNTAKLSVENNLVLSKPDGCDRVLVGYYPEKNKFFLYLGFDSEEKANQCRSWLIERGFLIAYNYKQDCGINKPRKAERLATDWELKVHRPSVELVNLMVEKDKNRG
ncbi:MAG: hypothetical protein SFT94_05855 [Pseudanabaenaceae cyanobacterium bins.68]|nr:hypothetical protein [Pseudanabaenaceae cyanobacterium bins.68]